MNVSERMLTLQCTRCNTFLKQAFLSTTEQQRWMREHLDAAHPYWDVEDLAVGARDYESNFRVVDRQRAESFCSNCRTILYGPVCPNCGAGFVKSAEKANELVHAQSDRKQLFGILGSTLLFFGVFTPIVSAPIVGNINYFQNGRGDGIIILGLSVLSIALVFAKKYGGLWFTGLGSFALMIFTFINFQLRMAQMEEEMDRTLAGNPFRGIADVAMQSIQMQWGWAVLVIGAALVIASAAIRD
jgi:hypothetical protein